MIMTGDATKDLSKNNLTVKILLGLVLGGIFGLLIKLLPDSWQLHKYVIDGIMNTGGSIFLNLIKMIVVPVVFISLVCGICSLDDVRKLGSLGIKTILLFIISTLFAVTLALAIAHLFNLGANMHLPTITDYQTAQIPTLQQFFIDVFPANPIKAMADGNMLQIIVFAIFFGCAINISGDFGKRIASFFNDLNAVIMKLIMMLMRLAPYGVFCLITTLFAKSGPEILLNLMDYFFTVLLVLLIYTFVVYSLLLGPICKLSPMKFFKKMYGTMLFAFGVSSSNATIPLALETVEFKLGVSNAVASFVIPLGTNINKNGTAIMQGVAAVFIANAYNIDIGISGYLLVALTATLASISTAGAPGIGMIALVMVLRQVGLPIEGIALILGIDRLLDMARTAVNVTGNAAIACAVAKSEKNLKQEVYDS